MTSNKDFFMEKCREVAAKNGGSLVSEYYVRARDKIKWCCSKGHIWEASYDNVNRGTWCPKCRGGVANTIDDCKKLAQEMGGECLSESYKNNNTILKLKCNKGHVWENTYRSMHRGVWCPECSPIKKGTIEACKELVEAKGGRLLSKKYKPGKNIRVECERGHRWKTSLVSLKAGYWCLDCSGTKKKTLGLCRSLAKSFEGKCLSKTYTNHSTYMEWECKNGHKWKSKLSNVRRGHWCPWCYNKIRRHTREDCEELAKRKGGKFLSENYTTEAEKYNWECEKGHVFTKSHRKVRCGYWCSVCSPSINQRLIYDAIKYYDKTLTVYNNFTDFEWLKGRDGHRQQIDIYVPELKLAIEYDGKQHFEPVHFGGITHERAVKNLEYIKERDARKDQKIAEHPEDINYFFRFNYLEKITIEYVLDHLKKSGCI